jgi:hypothetical protein
MSTDAVFWWSSLFGFGMGIGVTCILLSLVEPPVSEKPKVYTYIPLVSANRKLLVQVFLDPETNLIVQAQVATRYETWSAWGLPTEVFED